jgi:hypothetical protein
VIPAKGDRAARSGGATAARLAFLLHASPNKKIAIAHTPDLARSGNCQNDIAIA